MSKKSPQLRFEGFTDDWEERKLSEIGKIVTGNTPSTSNKGYYNGDFLFVSPADIQENRYVNKTTTTLTELGFKTGRLVPKGATLFVSIGSTIGKIGQSICDVITNQQINSVISFSDYDDDFIYTSILNSSTKIKQLAATQAVPIINKNEFGKSIIKIPSLEEQQKIGAFFKQLDDTIALHQRKLDLLKEQKKGYLQKMFPKNGAKVPELRFAGFADDWEERKLSSGLREYTDRVIVEDDKEYYQISVRNNFGGITLRGSKMGNKIGRKRQAKINLTKYPQTLIFTRQTVEQGGIGWVDKYCDGAIVTENMPTISLDTSVFSKYFLTNLFQTRIFYKNAILDNIEGGSAQIAIHESKFLSSTLLFPNLDEQEKIGQFFKQLDDTIDLHQRKLDLLKEQKKGYLQKMFPKNGAKVPELRFAGFADDWEERKLKELGDIQTGNTPPTSNLDNYSTDGVLWVTPTDIKMLVISDTAKKLSEVGVTQARIAKAGSILVTSIASIGKNTLVTMDAGFNQQINSLTPTPKNDSYFLLTQSEKWSEKMKKTAASATMQIVNKTDFSNISTFVPVHKEEQQKIGLFFKQLDNTITLHQRKLDLLKEQKKGFLQKMFV